MTRTGCRTQVLQVESCFSCLPNFKDFVDELEFSDEFDEEAERRGWPRVDYCLYQLSDVFRPAILRFHCSNCGGNALVDLVGEVACFELDRILTRLGALTGDGLLDGRESSRFSLALRAVLQLCPWAENLPRSTSCDRCGS